MLYRIETCLSLSKVDVAVRHLTSEVTDRSRKNYATQQSPTRQRLSRRLWEIYSTRHWCHKTTSSSSFSSRGRLLMLHRHRGTTSDGRLTTLIESTSRQTTSLERNLDTLMSTSPLRYAQYHASIQLMYHFTQYNCDYSNNNNNNNNKDDSDA